MQRTLPCLFLLFQSAAAARDSTEDGPAQRTNSSVETDPIAVWKVFDWIKDMSDLPENSGESQWKHTAAITWTIGTRLFVNLMDWSLVGPCFAGFFGYVAPAIGLTSLMLSMADWMSKLSDIEHLTLADLGVDAWSTDVPFCGDEFSATGDDTINAAHDGALAAVAALASTDFLQLSEQDATNKVLTWLLSLAESTTEGTLAGKFSLYKPGPGRHGGDGAMRTDSYLRCLLAIVIDADIEEFPNRAPLQPPRHERQQMSVFALPGGNESIDERMRKVFHQTHERLKTILVPNPSDCCYFDDSVMFWSTEMKCKPASTWAPHKNWRKKQLATEKEACESAPSSKLYYDSVCGSAVFGRYSGQRPKCVTPVLGGPSTQSIFKLAASLKYMKDNSIKDKSA